MLKISSALGALLIMLSGCMSINEEMLRKVDITPPSQQPLTVELKIGEFIQKLNGEGQNRGVLSGTTVLGAIGEAMMSRWQDKKAIADYAKTGELKRDPDYTVILSGTRNEDGSIAGAVLSGLSLLLIPTSATLTYDLSFELINNRNQKHYTVKAKNAVTTWMQILLFPALPFSLVGSNNMINDIADYSYNELRKQGAFNEQHSDLKNDIYRSNI